MEVSGSYKELSQVLDELKQSPEARRLIPPDILGMFPSKNSEQTTTEGKESALPHESEPKSNSE
jgi:hypothetical protein